MTVVQLRLLLTKGRVSKDVIHKAEPILMWLEGIPGCTGRSQMEGQEDQGEVKQQGGDPLIVLRSLKGLMKPLSKALKGLIIPHIMPSRAL